jgi:protein subunit release factor B
MSREKLFSVTMADCDISTFRAGGPGGQHQNTSDTAVRITHRASGATGEARDSRSQHQNKQAAWNRMVQSGKFRMWLSRRIMTEGRDLEADVSRAMDPRNIMVEGKSETGAWQIIG